MTPVITIRNLKFAYQNHQVILDIPKLDIAQGRLTIFHGRSGSGKSTLLKIIAGLLPKYGGHLTGEVHIKKPRSCSMMFQDPGVQFALDTPRHEIQFALENLQVNHSLIARRVATALQQVGINDLADRQFTTLSGGEQQRATLAVIIAMQRNIILLDEPFASLDNQNRQLIIDQLIKLQQSGKTIIIADHDLSAYSDLNPEIMEFTNHVNKLDEQRTESLLKQASKPFNLLTALPDEHASSLINIRNLNIKRNNVNLIYQPNLKVIKDKVTLLTGESGSGKTSFFKTLAGIMPVDGLIRINNRNLQNISRRKRGRLIGMVFQNANDQFLNVTVQEELDLSQKNGHNSFFNEKRLPKILDELGLSPLTGQVVYSLSGGQKKKLQILVMLMMGQPLLLMDEPFSGLDSLSIEKVIRLIQESRRYHPQTIMIISHQLTNLDKLVDFHLQLQHQKLMYTGGTKE